MWTGRVRINGFPVVFDAAFFSRKGRGKGRIIFFRESGGSDERLRPDDP